MHLFPNWVFRVDVAAGVTVLYLTVILLGFWWFGAFKSIRLFRVGPGEPGHPDTAHFIGLEMSTWPRVWFGYFVAITIGLLKYYHTAIMYNTLHNTGYRNYLKIPDKTKRWLSVFLPLEIVCNLALMVVEFYILFTGELQYIVAQLIGVVVVSHVLFFRGIY